MRKRRTANAVSGPALSRRAILVGVAALATGAGAGGLDAWAQRRPSVLTPVPRRPRPTTPDPALFTGKTAEAYRAARAAPELIEQMPCYCGCSKTEGHLNNLDCYVDRHAAT
jgi:hypothetical protein